MEGCVPILDWSDASVPLELSEFFCNIARSPETNCSVITTRRGSGYRANADPKDIALLQPAEIPADQEQVASVDGLLITEMFAHV